MTALSGRTHPTRPWIKDFHEPNAALKRPTLRQGTYWLNDHENGIETSPDTRTQRLFRCAGAWRLLDAGCAAGNADHGRIEQPELA
ncbi:hypothetical protein NKI36_09520 [Mesorhizobium caraganae]|uniref:Uncharacterized protein n=1 Tax=Mesorhizobium caraganae TaxID=483206 RepID=A0ABV1YX77_9HYPH